ncbi:MAG: TetR/AcrR family transcriptional regulator [Acidobacteriia bacterium]|nr:TetR/AcrR family transcriptional regulator [Terriglobia bacterium]
MPRLHPNIVDANRRKIERVALRLFCAQGFHGTSMREIATRSHVSLGNIYNYYKTKDELFTSIVNHYGQVMNTQRDRLLESIHAPFERDEILGLASRIRDVVYRYGDFWLLMYVDVTEFRNRHFEKFFLGLADEFRNRFRREFSQPQLRRGLKGLDPGMVFAAMWMQFFNYFLVERLFRGRRHFGMADAAVVKGLSQMYERVWRR